MLPGVTFQVYELEEDDEDELEDEEDEDEDELDEEEELLLLAPPLRRMELVIAERAVPPYSARIASEYR